MPRTRSLAWAELKIGVLTIVSIVIAAVLIFSLTGARGFFWQRYDLKARFSNVAGLTSGSPVRVAGVQVGSVTSVEFAGDQVDVTFEVNRNVQPRITTNSTASLGSVSLLGESAVDITPSTSGSPVPEWGYVRSMPAKGSIADVTAQATEGIDQITGLVRDMRGGRGTVGKLMTDDQLYAELRRFVTTANEVTDGIRRGRGSVGKLLNDPKTANALEASLANLETITRQINSGEGSLGKLLKDDSFSKSLTGATDNLQAVLARINRGEGTAGKLMTDTALYNRLTSVTDRLDTAMTRLNAGEGTAGLLLKDKQLYENINGAVGELRSLVADIRRDPKKFLNVKVSIW